jgi:hypothetical protein
VDAKHHLIVAHEVTNVGHDRKQLSPVTQAARQAMDKKRLKALADRGHYNAEVHNSVTVDSGALDTHELPAL